MPKRSFDMLVGTTAVKILDPNPKRLQYSIVNNGSSDIYLGGDSGLTTSSGEPVPPGAMLSDDRDREAVYAISTAADQDVRVTEILEA